MLQRFKNWLATRRARRAAWDAAWDAVSATGPDGLTEYERRAIAQLEPLVGPLSLTRNTAGCLSGAIPGTEMTLYLWADEAQVGAPDVNLRRERWDYDSPEASLEDLRNFIAARLQSNLAGVNDLGRRASSILAGLVWGSI
jgi:hypothetical protein